jgi:hypothetical protein
VKRVRMTRQRHWQNAGRERQLGVGDIVDLPPAIADALIATGAAVAVVPEQPRVTSPQEPQKAPEGPESQKAPETAASAPPETGNRRQR